MVNLIFLITTLLAHIIGGVTEAIGSEKNVSGIQKISNIISVNFTLVFIIIAFIEKSLILAIFGVLLFLFVPGTAQILTLLFTGKGYLTSPVSWIISLLSLGVIIFIFCTSNIAYI